MPRYPWRSSPQTTKNNQDTRARNQTWIRRFKNQFNLKSTPELEEETSQITCAPTPAPTPTTPSFPTTDNDDKISPLLNLPAELRQKILKYTITDADVNKHLLYESVQTSPSTWEARVYYFDGREFAWDDEVKMFSRAPFQESQALSLAHPLLKDDMEWVKKQWVKRVRAIGEEKRIEVLRDLEMGEVGAFTYRGFGESSRFPKGDVRSRVASLMMGAR